jgi:predicted phosphoadenosine phosphosulfate sulfurtransferase
MRIYLNKNVMEAGLERFRWLFDEFENLIVCISGGKDSTVTFQLAMKVAEEKGRLPLKVMFLDQEAEWQMTIDYVRTLMNDQRVHPIWLQIPFKIFNATSSEVEWLQCWEPGAKWMREKELNAVTENVFGSNRFADLFGRILKHYYPGQKAVMISGVRCEESPGRLVGLTSYPTYKGETWGKARDKAVGHYDMYPLYDWSYTDIWKAIHDNGWDYCKVYDAQYQYGVSLNDMRVSNLNHETAVRSLFYLQEVERDTWNRLTERLKGVSTAGQLADDAFSVVKKLPFMFRDWKEYRDYLLEKLPETDEARELFRAEFQQNDKQFSGISERFKEQMYKSHIAGLLANDWHMTKIRNKMTSGPFMTYRRYKQGLEVDPKYMKGLIDE